MIASVLVYQILIIALLPLVVACFWADGRHFLISVAFCLDSILLLAIFIDWKMTKALQSVSCFRTVSNRLSIGRANLVVITVENLGQNDLQMFVRDDFPFALQADRDEFKFVLKAGSACELNYNLIPKRRGSYDFGAVHLRYLSCLRLFWRQLSIEQKRTVKVFSDLKGLQELSVRLTKSDEVGEIAKRRLGQGTEFAFLRNYTSGDDVGAIDWKATARHRSPQVRVYEQAKEQNLLILVDGGRSMMSYIGELRRFDHALNAAVSLAMAGLNAGDQVGIGVFCDQILLDLPARRGKAQLKQIAEAVFNLSPKASEPDYQKALSYFSSKAKGRSLIVVLTDLTDMLSSESLLSGLAKLTPRHLPFCVTFKDEAVEALANQATKQLQGNYRRAVAVEIVNEREVALSKLLRAGCLVLDAPPDKLTNNLVDKYLQVKARGLL